VLVSTYIGISEGGDDLPKPTHFSMPNKVEGTVKQDKRRSPEILPTL